jgi:methionyl-tRNA formyltransferase
VNLKVVFMGSPEFAVPTLRALHANFHVTGVLTQADKPRGRGLKNVPTAVKAAALDLGLPVQQPDRLSDPATLALLREWDPAVIVVAAYGKILPHGILTLPPLGCVNLHASLLPRYRGASPITAAILAGDAVTGVCTIVMDEGMDTGAVLLTRQVPIGDEDTTGTLHDRLSEPGAMLVVETLNMMEKHEIRPAPQDNAKATYTKPLSKTEGKVDWHRDAQYLSRHVRAMNPWPGAFFSLSTEAVKLWEASAEQGVDQPGRITAVRQDGIVVGTGQGLLLLRRVQAPSKKKVSGAELARARGLREGDCLG